MRPVSAWMILSLPILAACSVAPVRPVRPVIPDALLVPQPVPTWTGGTLRQALEWCIESNHAALSCEADRARVRTINEGGK